MASLFLFVNLLWSDEKDYSDYKINTTTITKIYFQDYSFNYIYYWLKTNYKHLELKQYPGAKIKFIKSLLFSDVTLPSDKLHK